ncbi:conserved exported hypothetical protein [Tenacibaculum sediminilitoris]|uniref:hypothetical protein n=1 Tax=Tenacibaculum sediminilitoris TaxID=1820334 RepID=UPI0038957417
MKTKNCLLLIVVALISLNLSAQKTSEKKIFDVVIEKSAIKSNQLVLDFLRTNSRLKSYQLNKLIDIQKNTNTNNYESSNTRKLKEFGKPSPTITTIYFDNEIILGEGINRLYLLDQVRMKEIAKITRSNVSYNKEIHIYKL